MSIDVGGWIEVRPSETAYWKGLERLEGYIDSANGMLDCLFGLGLRYPFRPVASGRGVRGDASSEVQREVSAWSEAEATETYWITLAEISAIDWDEQAVSGYEREVRTERGKLMVDTAPNPHKWERLEETLDRMGGWPEGSDELEVDGAIYRRILVARSTVKSEDWQLLFRKLESLGGVYGPDGVRLVIWLIA